MNDPTLIDDEPLTEVEAERLALARAEADKIEREFPGTKINFKFLSNEQMVEQIDASEAAVFVGADRFFMWKPPKLPIMPAVEIHGVEWLRDELKSDSKKYRAAQVVKCRHFGITGGMQDGVEVPPMLLFRLTIRGKETPLYIDLKDAPDGWLPQAMKRCVAVWPEEEGARPFMATGSMRQFPEGFVMPPKVGRNDPCPCGSGRKLKRCCAAI